MISNDGIAASMAMDNPNQERQYLEAERKDGIRELMDYTNRLAEYELSMMGILANAISDAA